MDIAAHLRIFNADPSDELVQKRQPAISEVAAFLVSRGDFAALLSLADSLAGSVNQRQPLPEELTTKIESAIRSANPSFVREGQDLQIKVCGLLAALAVLESATAGGTELLRSEVLAVGLWSALSFQKPLSDVKFERLRVELLRRAEALSLSAAENSRKRVSVLGAQFSIPEEEGLEDLERRWQEGPLKAIDALRLNATLDREELDLLWWALNDWSAIFKTSLSKLDNDVVGLAAGLEMGSLLKRLPATAHKHLATRCIKEEHSYALGDLLDAIGNQAANLARMHAENTLPNTCPHVFPLLTALRTGQAKGSGSKEARTRREWAARALLESALLRISSLPQVLS